MENNFDNTTAVLSEKEMVAAKLQEFGIGVEITDAVMEDYGVESVDDLSLLTESDLVSVGVKAIQARKLLATFVEPIPQADTSAFATASFVEGILPAVPDDGSWLEALKTGGVLKVDQSSVISAVRAIFAYRVGLFDVPTKIVKAMEEFAEINDEPVDPSYFSLKRQLTKKNYAEIFSAVDGLDSSYVTEKAKKKFFDRMNNSFLPAIFSFYNQLKSWQDAWTNGATNPAIMMAAFMGNGAALPPGMMQAPDTGALRDQGDAVSDAINKAFAGIGVQITAALAYEAMQTKKILTDTRLPSLVGAANRDQMLRQLDIAISSTQPRLETNFTKFVLATIQAKDQPAGNEELQYFGSLYMLGSQIPWDELGVVSGVTNINGYKQL